MGVIRKKTISRGTEGGLKYICDVCSKDITATVCPSLALRESWHLVFWSMADPTDRFVYDVTFAPTMICAYPALRMQQNRVNMTLRHMNSS